MEENKAPFFEMPNEANELAHAPAFYGSTRVPHPTNSVAKKVNHAKVMMQVMDAK